MRKKNHKSGFVSIIGRPNVGKSTLINALMEDKLSIITSKAQTTRHRIRGIINGDDYQILFTASKSKRKYIKILSSKMNQKISIIGQINTKSKNYLLDNRRIPIKYLKYQGYSHIF